MNSDNFRQLEERSALALEDIIPDARRAVQSEIERMVEGGQALHLSDEEERVLRAFRAFKARCRKPGQVFTWQTRPIEGVTLAPEQCLIVSPEEGA